jgi:hypothetical protein
LAVDIVKTAPASDLLPRGTKFQGGRFSDSVEVRTAAATAS